MTNALATATAATIGEFALLLVALMLVILGVAINSAKYVGIGVIVLIVGLMIFKYLPGTVTP